MEKGLGQWKRGDEKEEGKERVVIGKMRMRIEKRKKDDKRL